MCPSLMTASAHPGESAESHLAKILSTLSVRLAAESCWIANARMISKDRFTPPPDYLRVYINAIGGCCATALGGCVFEERCRRRGSREEVSRELERRDAGGLFYAAQ